MNSAPDDGPRATDGTRSVADATASATLLASRSLLGFVARSLAPVLEELTLVQFRILVVLEGAEPMRMADLADAVGVHPSTLSRTVDRLEAGGWVSRVPVEGNRREVHVEPTAGARELVADVTRRRRAEILATVASLPAGDQEQVRRGMELFAAAAGEASPGELLELGL
ncbi:MarR family transcriptional regulator [Demequina capsici]|uniref:MarR family transcriptional regulator n=1 Tax=Demequina capsici TaxID=3075620 RepID=A0AA96FDB7_9MICO|nr:MarR family transcriptional regulator [Demequina sp. PMTSA13]WNM28209.1 MarR family transcriptional regulator [Demequina sp. PMTSA13]